ncbi:MAG: hypothetical protein FWE70_06360, partial [Oscillospiraceae bacterium]|nr:hypothetical protein [Oscillospiraceae bacterium]
MTGRERFNDVFSFRAPAGRMPMVEWAAWWGKTVERWQAEGLPAMGFSESLSHFGLDEMHCVGARAVWEELPPGRDGHGPISCMDDYLACRGRMFRGEAIEAFRGALRRMKGRHDRGEIIIRVWLDGFFWFPRTLMGIEPHLLAFHDEPELMHAMNRDLAEFNVRVMEACLSVLRPDMVGYAEDMSYNHGPMLSEALFDEFLLPYYLKVNGPMADGGVRILVDTDGDVTSMIPWLIRAGIGGVYPLERQAGVDICAIRKAYPRFLMLGGFDKMCMDKGEGA